MRTTWQLEEDIILQPAASRYPESEDLGHLVSHFCPRVYIQRLNAMNKKCQSNRPEK